MSDRATQTAAIKASASGAQVGIRDILTKHLGQKNLLPESWYENILTWGTWYAGATPFHRYKIYNGQSFVDKVRRSLGMAKKMAEDKADLLLNEKVEISVSRAGAATDDDVLQDKLDAILQRNNFWVRGNQLVEVAHALGTGALVEYKDGDSVGIDYIPATMIYPLKWTKRDITECAFASVRSIDEKTRRVFISRHIKEGGEYVVYNDVFIVGNNNSVERGELDAGILPVWRTGSETPCFQFITPNIVNNIDLSNPMGVSVFGNAIDLLEAADLAFDSFVNEFQLGKKRIFVDASLLNISPLESQTADGDPLLPLFDNNDTAFYALPFRESTAGSGKPIEESNMELRIEEHRQGIQTVLDMLSDKAGFGKGYYRFDVDTAQTATAVVSANSKLFRNIQKDELIIDKALTDMVNAIMRILGVKDALDIGVSFDDSIIEDTNALAARALVEYNTGLIDAVEYFMRVYDMTEDAAVQKVAAIEARRPAPPQTDNDIYGA